MTSLRPRSSGLLGSNAPPDAVPTLLWMSGNFRPDVRQAAATALDSVDPDGRRSGPALTAAVLQRDPAMIAALLPPARVAKDPAALAWLKAAAADEPDPEVREVAARVLADPAR